MNHSFDHILHKPCIKDHLSGLTDTFETANNAAVFTTGAARSAAPDWMNPNLKTGAAATAKHWMDVIGDTSCTEQITGSMAYLTQPAVSSIFPSLSSGALVPNAAFGMGSSLTTEQPTGYGGVNQLTLNNGALTGFTAGSAALLNHDTVLPYATLPGSRAASEAVMHDYVSLFPKTSEYPLTSEIGAQTGIMPGNANLHGDTSFALYKYGTAGAFMQDAISVKARSILDHSYLYGMTDPTTSIRATSELYPASFVTGNNGYVQTVNGASYAANAFKINSHHDLSAASYLVTANKGFVHALGAAAGAVFDNQAWKVNAHNDMHPGSFRVRTEPGYLATLGSGAVYTNHPHDTDYGIRAALKATQWHSGMAVSPSVGSALSVNGLVNSYALSVDSSLKALSIPLGVAGMYGSGAAVTAGISKDAYKMVTGADAIWKNGALSFGSEAWSTKNVGIYHDYRYPSRSQEVVLPSYSEPTISEEVEIKYILKSRLSVLNTSLAVSYQGAAEALNHRRADHVRQACISMRQLLDFFVNELFTIEEFRQWSGYNEDLLRLNWKGEVIGVQRKAAYQFVTRKLQSAPEPKKFLELMEKCNGGCHRFDGNYSLHETVALFHKCEAMLEVLLNATDATSN